MLSIIKKSTTWCNKELSVQIGELARQSDSAVLVKYAGVTVLCAMVVDRNRIESSDFLPLTVNFMAKSYSFGKIPGGFFKREGKPSEQEVLISRIIDRSIRPFFPKVFNYAISASCILLSHDFSVAPEIPAILAASIASSRLTNVPFAQTIAAIKAAQKDGSFIFNPSSEESADSAISLTLAGTANNISMIEASCCEASVDSFMSLVEEAKKVLNEVIDFINTEVLSQPALERKSKEDSEVPHSLIKFLREELNDEYFAIFEHKSKKAINNALFDSNQHLLNKALELGFAKEELAIYKPMVFKELARQRIVQKNKRLDGRGFDEIRPIDAMVEVLPHIHGSALFTRGNTQVLAVATLGTAKDQQTTECLYSGGEKKEKFFLHYNFPSFATGEISNKPPGPNRREIGHGRLAAKAIKHFLPTKHTSPNAVRVVAEVLESDGSSSMATVCATSMALMDAGVDIKKPVAGIAMGLISHNEKNIILSDISGVEDMFGDMDLKAAGTDDGITALQLDIKISGVGVELIRHALLQAHQGVRHILAQMAKAISIPRASTRNAGGSLVMQIDQNKIRDLIGAGGKNIKHICETANVAIDVLPTGMVTISASNAENIASAQKMILETTSEPKVGAIYPCKVVKIIEFGILVSFMGNKQGLIHSSEINQKVDVGTKLMAALLSASNDKYKLSAKKAEAANKDGLL